MVLPLERMEGLLSGRVAIPRWSDITKIQPKTLKDLVALSILDTTPMLYVGPPIGLAAIAILHTDPITHSSTTTTYGTLAAPRPVVAINCMAEKCMVCRPLQPTIIVVHDTVDGKLPIPDPMMTRGAKRFVVCVDEECEVCLGEVEGHGTDDGSLGS